jgi:hypothetical protein
VDTPLSFGTFNSYPEVISLLIPLAFKRDKRVLPHFNLLGVIVGGILLSSIGFYFPLSYFNLFNEWNTLDEILVCLITPVKSYSNAFK